MKIEKDKINIIGGVRGKKTIGSPISFEIKNKDFENWVNFMSPMDEIDRESRIVENVRPGHADLVGALKYDFDDARNVLERSSARETASRVAVGALCKQVLKQFNIEFASHIVKIGDAEIDKIYDFKWINDFSAARNYSFSKATNDYIMWLDADDVLLEEDYIKLQDLKESLDESVDMVVMKYNMSFDKINNHCFYYNR